MNNFNNEDREIKSVFMQNKHSNLLVGVFRVICYLRLSWGMAMVLV